MRSYKQSHPWLKFETDLRKLDYETWILLGEAQSKCEHISNAPLRPDVANQLHRLFLAKGVRATTAIEGNTLSEEQVIQQLQGKLELPSSKEYLRQEIINIEEGCREVYDDVINHSGGDVSVSDVMRFNKKVLNGLRVPPEVTPGQIRTHSVGIDGMRYRGAPAKDCDYLVARLCDWLRAEFTPPSPEQKITFGLIKAIIAHLYLAWIHPFGDGNGRTARLIEFKILLASGVPTPAAHLLSNHYNETRTEYYRQLDAASKSGGDIIPFLTYAITGFVEGLRSQLVYIRDQQWDVTWRNYVHELFRGKKGKVSVRRREVALDLSRLSEPVPSTHLNRISPNVAALYANVTQITVIRDINELQRMKLIRKTKDGVTANRAIILQFLPERATN